jgi:hypothetical protein
MRKGKSMEGGPISEGKPTPGSEDSIAGEVAKAISAIVRTYRNFESLSEGEAEVGAVFLKNEGRKQIYTFTARYQNGKSVLNRSALETILRDSQAMHEFKLRASVRSASGDSAEIVVEPRI